MKVLLAPLDWGLGHATRSLTLAHALEASGHEVCIASCGGALNLLRQALPGRAYWELPDYRIDYPKSSRGFAISLMRQAPKILAAIREEQAWVNKHAKQAGFDALISDGRYGIWHPDLPSIFVTHQLALLPPEHIPLRNLVMTVAEALNRRNLRRFTEVWVPDLAQAPGLSGRLGHPHRIGPQVRYIGPLNRFAWEAKEASTSAQSASTTLDWLAIVSGPEPQRTLFETELRRQLESLPGTRVLVQGLPALKSLSVSTPTPNALTIWPHLPGELLLPLMHQAKAIVSRAGYTTIMELACLDIKPVLMVATPGQPEQEHLAEVLGAGGYVLTQKQEAINLAQALTVLPHLKGLGAVPGLHSNLPSQHQGTPAMSRQGMLTFLAQHPIFGRKADL